jgi:hypothetical protein
LLVGAPSLTFFTWAHSIPPYFPPSDPSARRTKALLIGINYRGSGSGSGSGAGELPGCHNGVEKMQQWAIAQGFSASNMQVLMDDGIKTAPTKANIWAAMMWLAEGAQAGDALLFHFSGHGGQVKDESGDEASGFHQAMIPVDHKKAGIILDDDILDKILKPLPAGVDMFCITDCCHSGTFVDLPYTVLVDGKTGAALSEGKIENEADKRSLLNMSIEPCFRCTFYLCFPCIMITWATCECCCGHNIMEGISG